MAVPVPYPKVSLEAASGSISRWLVADGETVTSGQVIFEIDNDKAAVEVEAPADGTLHRLADEGDLVEVGALVATILVKGEEAPIIAPGHVPTDPTASGGPPPATSLKAPDGGMGSDKTSTSTLFSNRTKREPNPTPLARRIAHEHGIALAGILGTGPGGRVQKKDVLALLAEFGPAAPVIGRFAPLNSVWLRRGESMPVVLVHGYSADLNNWRGMLAGAQVPHPLLALDLPAHGDSPRDLPADLDELAVQLAQTVSAQVSGPVVLAGHSFGAAALARLAARGLLDVRALCLISPAGLHPSINMTFAEGILRAQQPKSLRPWLEMLVHDPQVITDAFVSAVAAQRQDAELTRAMSDFAAHFFADGTQGFSIRDDLDALAMPVRMISGKQDRVLPPVDPLLLPAHVGLHLISMCGHMPHLEHPVLIRRLLGEVWRSAF